MLSTVSINRKTIKKWCGGFTIEDTDLKIKCKYYKDLFSSGILEIHFFVYIFASANYV